MKTTWKIFWGGGFILLSVALILDAIGVLSWITSPFGEISLIGVVGAFLLLAYAISRIVKGAIEEIFLPLAFIFMIFERNIATVLGLADENIINNWLLFGCAVLLWIGFSILFSGIRKKGRGGIVFTKGEGASLGSSVKYIDCRDFKREEIENDLGSYSVYFNNVDKYEGGGVLEIDNNLGHIQINVPTGWNIVMQVDNSLGGTSYPSENYPEGPTLTIIGDNSLGSVAVKYV